ncbi:hypothetical protein [Microtetraspora sp. NBRC 16547]|uniref:hypothetical protein n=1 Tax=Microtetraspora sp. NBRC 16547 TaxID=3030993 RepID=UPI0024A3C292|nr:hypothetical protein [Microtetraspora sp. NBRC 16547]GLW96918.1 hypothetical protein Misp02_10050 [Microtetraspora sp. NBRC 16547]
MDRLRGKSGTRAVAAAAVSLAVLLAGLSGCADSQYTYVRDDDGGTYFKVPSAWRKVDQGALDTKVFGDLGSEAARLQKRLTWTVGFDAHAKPSADHLLAPGSLVEDQPFVMAKVQTLTPSQQNETSLNTLRNSSGLPVAISGEVRQQLESSAAWPFRGFELVADQVLPVRDGVRGIRTIFNYRLLGGPVQTFDETAYLSADGTHVSTLLIRCTAACYQKQAKEIDLVAQSFKVKRITS